jgi:hypothetical protein
MKLTTKKLTKNDYGTGCGEDGNTCLSQPLVIEFIDTFFNGVLNDMEVENENDINIVMGGNPTLNKLTITNDEFKRFYTDLPGDKDEAIEVMADLVDLDVEDLYDVESIDEDKHPEIICFVFGSLIGAHDGSFRCEWMFSPDNTIELESE